MAATGPRSSRLTYVRLRPDNLTLFYELVRDAYVRRYLFDGALMDRSWCDGLVAASCREEQSTGLGMWLLYASASQGADPLGFAGFYRLGSDEAEPQLVYALREHHTRQGLAREAAVALLEWAWACDRPHVDAEVDEVNVHSMRLLERLGFARVRESKGAFGPMIYYRLRAVDAQFGGRDRT